MITIKKFISMIEEELSPGVELRKLMVGDRVINYCADADRSVHFFLLDNCPWYVHTQVKQEEAGDKILLFITGVCKSQSVIISPQCKVSFLKETISQITGIPDEDMRLVTQGKQLESERMLNDYNIRNGHMVFVVLRLRGGGFVRGIPFADVTEEAGPEKIKWNKSAPKWRRAALGLCLEGKCTNRRCKAHNKLVIVNKGYTEFDMIRDAHISYCPICNKHVQPLTCGFNNCKYQIITEKVVPGKPTKISTVGWKSVGDYYERYNPQKRGTANFVALKILCKEDTQDRTCTMCTESMTQANTTTARCGHKFHSHCFGQATDHNCIECFSIANMTRFQNIFSE